MRKKNVLIITSSGGGGHIAAATARAHDIHKNHPDWPISQRDILVDWLSRPIGTLFAGFWNFAQKKGSVSMQKFLIFFQRAEEFVVWPIIFLCAFYNIQKDDIDLVIDTQPMNTSAILKAMRLYMVFSKKTIICEKVLVDLPTDRALHYFRNIKKLSKKDRAHLKLLTTKPLLEKYDTETDFWKNHTGHDLENIIYADFPLRPTFKEIDSPFPAHKPCTIAPKIPTNEILETILPAIKRGHIEYDYCQPYLDITIPSHARVCLVMLGSRPSEDATFNYVDEFIKFKQQANQKIHDILFVFCRKGGKSKRNLLRRVCDHVAKHEHFPQNLTIIPLPYQDDRVIAPLVARSDFSITRSGGATSMELLSHMEGNIWIHSETKANSEKQLIDGIPAWEKGNAKYLCFEKKARLITPYLMVEELLTAAKN